MESLARRAYAHIPPLVKSELARDQFIRALSPAELRIHTQLARPRDLAEALELALEREMAVEAAMQSAVDPSPTIRAAGGGETASPRPEWLEEITEMIRGWRCPQPSGRHSIHRPAFAGSVVSQGIWSRNALC